MATLDAVVARMPEKNEAQKLLKLDLFKARRRRGEWSGDAKRLVVVEESAKNGGDLRNLEWNAEEDEAAQK